MIINQFDHGYPKGSYYPERISTVAAQQKWLSIELVNDPFAADALSGYIMAMEEDGDYKETVRTLKSVGRSLYGPDSF